MPQVPCLAQQGGWLLPFAELPEGGAIPVEQDQGAVVTARPRGLEWGFEVSPSLGHDFPWPRAPSQVSGRKELRRAGGSLRHDEFGVGPSIFLELVRTDSVGEAVGVVPSLLIRL